MKNNKISIIFVGTPEFGIPVLVSLASNNDFNILGVITQPDKKFGRQQIVNPPPIKKVAFSYGLPVYQPEKINNFAKEIKNLKPDLILVVAYAQILSEEILSIPRYGCLNVHGSLLPKYRGAACIPTAILNGDKKTGITIMKIDKGLDSGPIIAQEEINIDPDETSQSLSKKLSALAGKTTVQIIKKYINGELPARPQDDSLATKTKMLKKNDGLIDWNNEAEKIERFIRAMYPWPGAFSYFNSKRLVLVKAENEILQINQYKIGEVFLSDKQVAVQCKSDAIILNTVKLEGKKEMPVVKFLNGYQNFIGSVLSAT
ncbi:MAG: methionyl-tRNA formyltransferase [Candidatus Falkowbacteria bacterium]|nr:methionyl-tRNA formyltransferase [Candidatus Falkowbacteria bacterium]